MEIPNISAALYGTLASEATVCTVMPTMLVGASAPPTIAELMAMPIIVEWIRWLWASVIAIGTIVNAAWEVPMQATAVRWTNKPHGISATRSPIRPSERSTSQSTTLFSRAMPNK